MRPFLTHKGYEAWSTVVGGELWATIKTPRRVIIAEVPAVPTTAGVAALKPLIKAAIERDIQTRR